MKNNFDQFKKKTELEILYQSTLKLETEGKINIEDGFKECLINEGTKKRCYHNKSQLLSKEQLESIKNLRNNKDIIIRKADKSNIYVIMNYSDYKQKLDDIISDKSKFIQLKKDPTESLKKKLNNIIKCENAAQSNIKMKVLEGNYKPGYLYGNAKIHKDQANPKLRPIISQVNSPTYQVAKDLNNIIIKYMPKKYMINSTDEFLDILKSTENKENGILASLDVDSLFTNIPVEETIEIILQNVYNHNQLSKPAISKTILKKLLLICTTESPFKHINGDIYYQKDGVSMGSPLGPTFANFYMCHIENKILKSLNHADKPIVYTRYVDDIYVKVKNENHLEFIKKQFILNSKLNFTTEMGGNKLSFLDVQLEENNGKIKTSTYTKSTNFGATINYRSECPERYKIGAITTLLNRCYKICSSWDSIDNEINRLKQVFVNNGYSNCIFDKTVEKFLNDKYSQNENLDKKKTINLFYENQMTENYKLDEKVLKDIFRNKIKCINSNEKIHLLIYYKSKKVSNLLMRNNLNYEKSEMNRSHMVYKINCPVKDCDLSNPCYVGYTQNTIEKRLSGHLYNGAPKDHMIEHHNRIISKKELENNVKCIKMINDIKRLQIYEALIILKTKPSINRQIEEFNNTLKLFVG